MPARYIARSSGGSAVRSAAYNARDAITAERTGELHYFKHRDACWHCRPTKTSASRTEFELARAFADQHFVVKGLAVQLDVHTPHAFFP